MQYPPEFVAKCKRLYPNWTDLHRYLDAGDVIVGRYLDDNRSYGVSFPIIFAANTLAEVQKLARESLERNRLYAEWYRLYEQEQADDR